MNVVQPADAEGVTPQPKPKSRWRSPASGCCWLGVAIALVALSCFRFPDGLFNKLLDPSWSGVLVHAHEKGMQFGSDIVFTYGPLGFLSIASFLPQVAGARIIFEILVGLWIASGLCFLAWRIAVPWRLAMLGYFLFVSMPLHWGGDALVIDVGIFCWGLLCLLESGPRLRVYSASLAMIVGTGALVKFTFLVSGLFTIVLVACDLLMRGRRALAVGIIIWTLLAFVSGWLVLGQHLSALGAYLSTSYAMAEGYNAAMGSDFGDIALVLVMVAATIFAATIRCVLIPVLPWRKALLWAWITGLLYLNWKHVCVRADYYQMELLFTFMPMVAVGMEALPAARRQSALWSSPATLVCLFVSVAIINGQLNENFFPLNCVKQTCKNMAGSLGVIVQPAQYIRKKTEAFQSEQKAEQLPQIRAAAGGATVDVFGYSQSYALFNGLNYHPRPVFQSYMAYNLRVMDFNEQFYLSDQAPQFVLFDLSPIDGRFPPVEDAHVLRDMLFNYRPILNDERLLLLRRIGTEKPEVNLIKEGTVSAGEAIDLQPFHQTNLWLEIELRSSLVGCLRQFLYKPPTVRLVLRRGSDGAPAHAFAVPAAMLSAGFLANPVLLDKDDVKRLYDGGKVSRPDSYSIEVPPNALKFWQPQIHFKLYGINNKIGPGSL